MQTCSKCNASSPDEVSRCIHCDADLKEYSTRAVALTRLRANPRVRAIRVTVAGDACSACYGAMNTYTKDEAPRLPLEGCSHENGCRCFYEPVLSETAIISKVEK
jgi:hypothetical protein